MQLFNFVPNEVIVSKKTQQFSIYNQNEGCVPTLIITTHLTMPSPRPDRAPHRPAIVWTRHSENRKPIQLKKNDTETIQTAQLYR